MKKVSSSDLPFVPALHEDPEKPGVWKKVLFRRDDFPGERKVQMVNWARLPAGGGFSEHYHEDMEEVFIMVSGTAEMRVGEAVEKLVEGDAVIVPSGARHSMRNPGNEDAEFIVFGLSSGEGGRTIVVEERSR